ncbi:glycosyltransferase [Galbitalea sp. SE-J8]|uniref:glycosyltransferase n=1 Tax=Galbitalea sp. SE-J8 TaxID=3054952 RepID=UPI00259CFA6F|nr:glycosyltransferase [Galbitalea sp. SE-J8]MDM4762969.1 glycosyltransferase [Galbitalea sp. SE-J8]
MTIPDRATIPDRPIEPDRAAGVVARDTFVAVVSIVDDSTTDVVGSLRAVQRMLAARYTDYEIILVDRGLSAAPLRELRDTLHTVPCVRVIRMPARTDFDAAVFAGLEAAIADFVCVIDFATDELAEIPRFVDIASDGSTDVVQGISTVPFGGSLLSRVGRRLFYWYNRRFLDVDIPTSATYLTALTRRAVNALTSSRRSQRYLRHLVRHIGLHTENASYTPHVQGRRARNLRTGVTDAVRMISSYSTHPLRIVTVVGFFAGCLNLLYALYVVVIRLVQGDVEAGWTSTSLQMSVMFFFIFVILAVMTEYTGRILSESRREPDYFILEELESDVIIADVERRNVSNG